MSSPARQLDPATLNDESRGGRMNAMFFSQADNFGGPPLLDADEHEGDSSGESHHQFEQPENFSPIFTMVQNEASGERWHPHVHYIFSDDSDEILTNAVLRTLEGQPDGTASEVTAAIDNPAAQPSTTTLKERYIILDLDATGQQVTSAQSLSPDWQVSEILLTTAPTFGDTSAATSDAGMMLQIRGAQGLAADAVGDDHSVIVLEKAKVQSKHDIHNAMLNLADKFQHDLDSVQALMRQWDQS